MKFSGLLLFFCALLTSTSLWAHEESGTDETAQLRAIVQKLMDDNAAFVKSHKPDYYKSLEEGQHPRATVLTCADAPVQTSVFNKTPDGDLFVVRNLGNQLAASEGSVEYGVRRLNTPLLIIVGHSACSAIKAAYNISQEPEAVRHELATLKLPPKNAKIDADEQWLQGVQGNVNRQVESALKKFDSEVGEGKLTVIGAVYDPLNAMKQGQGRLVITNINGKTDAGSIMGALMKFSGIGMKLDKKPSQISSSKKPEN